MGEKFGRVTANRTETTLIETFELILSFLLLKYQGESQGIIAIHFIHR